MRHILNLPKKAPEFEGSFHRFEEWLESRGILKQTSGVRLAIYHKVLAGVKHLNNAYLEWFDHVKPGEFDLGVVEKRPVVLVMRRFDIIPPRSVLEPEKDKHEGPKFIGLGFIPEHPKRTTETVLLNACWEFFMTEHRQPVEAAA